MAIKWSYKRRELFADSKGRKCAHCGINNLVSKRDGGGVIYNIDHIIPQSRGGTDGESNLQLLCQPCNNSKNSRSSAEFPQHHIYKTEVESMQVELAETAGLEDVYIKRMLHSFSVKDRHHVLSKLLQTLI